MGYEQIILPKKNADKLKDRIPVGNCRIVSAANLYDAIDAFKGEC